MSRKQSFHEAPQKNPLPLCIFCSVKFCSLSSMFYQIWRWQRGKESMCRISVSWLKQSWRIKVLTFFLLHLGWIGEIPFWKYLSFWKWIIQVQTAHTQVPEQPSLCHAGMSPGLPSHSSRHNGCSKFPNYWGLIKWKQNSLQSLRRDVLTHSKESICAHFSNQFYIQQPLLMWAKYAQQTLQMMVLQCWGAILLITKE